MNKRNKKADTSGVSAPRKKPYVVAIDGPAGAGKSSIARGVADARMLGTLDTGALYRAMTWAILEAELKDDAIDAFAPRAGISIVGNKVFVGSQDVTLEIRSPRVTEAVSQISANRAVRAALLDIQRKLGRQHPVGTVLEGRDIGTVVFPDAEVKIFLTASDEARAQRRTLELERLGTPMPFSEVLERIRARDAKDSSRTEAPLCQADDARVVDSTDRTPDEVIQDIMGIIDAKIG